MSLQKTLLSFIFASFACLAVSAQSKVALEQDVSGRPILQSNYYGQMVDFDTLSAEVEVHSVRLENAKGESVLYSFDTEEEVDAMMARTLGARKASTYCRVYANSYYGGESYTFFDGKDYNDLGETRWNDKISSFSCTPGAYMWWFEHHTWYGSNYNTQTSGLSSHTNIHTFGWGDKITAIIFSW